MNGLKVGVCTREGSSYLRNTGEGRALTLNKALLGRQPVSCIYFIFRLYFSVKIKKKKSYCSRYRNIDPIVAR